MEAEPLSPENAVLLFIDQQQNILARTHQPDQTRNRILALARSAVLLGVPAVLTTNGADDPNGQQVKDDNVLRNLSGKLSWQTNRNNQLHFFENWNNRGQFHRGTLGQLADSAALFYSDQYTTTTQARWNSLLESRSSRIVQS